MLSSVTLDDSSGNPVTLHETTKRALVTATGLIGVGTLRDSKRVRPSGHGAINETRWEDGKTIVLEGEVWSQVSLEDAYTEFRAVTAPMIQTLDNGPALLKWTEGNTGNRLQRLVKLDGEVTPPLQEGAAILHYQAQFFAEDPRAYSQGQVSVDSASLSASGGGHLFPTTYPRIYTTSGGGTATISNTGNRATPPVFRIYGMVQNPQIVNLATQQRVALLGTINTGDFLEVDVARRTIKLNGATNRSNFLDAANTQWFEVQQGTTSLQMVAASFDTSAKLTTLLRSAYA